VPTPTQWQHLKDAAKLNLASNEQADASSKDGSAVLIQRRESRRTLVDLMRLPSHQRSTVIELIAGAQISTASFDSDWLLFSTTPKNYDIQTFDIYAYRMSSGHVTKIGASEVATPGPLAFPQTSGGYAFWAQGTQGGRRSALHRYDLNRAVDTILDTDINTGEAFSVGQRTIWYMKTDQPSSSTPEFTMRAADVRTGKAVAVPAALTAASINARGIAATDNLVTWISNDTLTLSAWSEQDGVVQLHQATGSNFIDFAFLAGPFVMWTGGKHETALDLRSGTATDITRSDYDLPGYALASGGNAVTVTDAASGKRKGEFSARSDAVIDASKLEPLPNCKTGRGMAVIQ
jgi:hypothetical protein